jgi:hypothetical protein
MLSKIFLQLSQRFLLVRFLPAIRCFVLPNVFVKLFFYMSTFHFFLQLLNYNFLN